MRHTLLLSAAVLAALNLAACNKLNSDDDDDNPPVVAQCADGLDNDGDTLIDLDDPGCASAADNDETNGTSFACSDGLDNDSDGKIDFPNDPGCASAADNNETDPATLPVCSDGLDNDGDGKIDFGTNPGNDPGCASAADTDEADAVPSTARSRYSMNNQCWALRANGNGKLVLLDGATYRATATDLANAEPFFMKPSALGNYLFYNHNRQLLSVGAAPALSNVASAAATNNSEWTVLGVGDTAAYPPTPVINREPAAAEVAAYHNFVDPRLPFSAFTIASRISNTRLAVDGSGNLIAATAGGSAANESFSFEPLTADKCSKYPEAESNFTGVPFKGRQPDGSVLGHADVHVHISATEFLGGAQWGDPFHKFGVEHALGNCSAEHGQTGQLDLVGGVFTQDPDGHATDGWPTFSEWPGRGQLTHEAIYWKWLERSWASGLRVVVNDLVDNETLCELQRNAAGEPTRDCNSMNNTGQQAGTMYGMQDYIDAQYGGRGAGFFQIVHTPAEARAVIEDGKMAVVLGIEISELFDCKLNYSPLRMQRPFEETGAGGSENSYTCTRDSILTQMQRIHGWGVRQVISVHEFDNAFGGNGIFDGLVLNLGNREDTGGIPSGDIATLVSLISPDFNPALFQRFVENLPASETPTGEWWTTYDCPVETVGSVQGTAGFSGYLWENTGGAVQGYLSPPLCVPTGQDGRAGGTTPCYPQNVRQCNARWMTPIGEYAYGEMMKMGFLIDWDHMEMGTKTQLLELTEAQTPVYPLVSTHGTFGGTTNDQAVRMLRNGGFLYPSNGSSRGFRADMDETRGIHQQAMAPVPPALNGPNFLFGFGYGTDTNGLSGQTGPRDGNGIGGQPFIPLTYPFTLFDGEPFDSLSGFNGLSGVVFAQPSSSNLAGEVVRTWNEDIDGNAHHGMLSDFVQEIRLEGSPEQIRHLFNSAEAYLQTWQRTEAARAAIAANGLKTPAAPILRPAPPLGPSAP